MMTDRTPMGDRHVMPRHEDPAGLMSDDGKPDVVERLRMLLQRPIPSEDLAENTRMVAALPDQRDRLSTSLLLVMLGDERLALDVAFARRVVSMRIVHRVPHRSGDVLQGIANVNGELLPVARLDRLLGIVEGHRVDAALRRMVVVGERERPWIVAVDRVDGIVRFDASTFLAPPPTVSRALDGVTDALIRLEEGTLAARLDSGKLTRGLERCFA
jgi:chemotaxis-related protein WspD